MTSSLVQLPPSAHSHSHRPFTAPSTPLYHPQPRPAASAPTFIAPPLAHSHSSYPSCSTSTSSISKSRPKPCKKLSSSTTKHKSVQVSLEVKVERAKGFHAFFVPLAKSMPPAPPSSPVLGQRAPSGGNPSGGLGIGEDYFGGWDKQKSGKREEWVEDVSGDESMEIDSD